MHAFHPSVRWSLKVILASALLISRTAMADDDSGHGKHPPRAVPVTVQGTVAVEGTVRISGDPAPAAAVQGQSTCPQECSATPFADVVLFTVPQGKRLVIEHVSGFVTLYPGAAALYSVKTAVSGTYLGAAPFPGVALDHMLGPATQAGDTFSTSNSLRLYADPGTNVVFHVDVVAGTGAVRYVLASFSGYLVDA